MVGLVGAGKSTILEKLRLGEMTQSGTVEEVTYKNIHFSAWDLGGAGGGGGAADAAGDSKALDSVSGIILVVDSTNSAQIDQDPSAGPSAKHELESLLREDCLRGVPVLLYANKQDVAGAEQAVEVGSRLGMYNLQDRSWHIQRCSAVTEEGLLVGIERLFENFPKS